MSKKLGTILIVEDELPIMNVLTNKLTHEGYNVLQAPNGKIGLDMALKKKPDLVLLDIIMPVMDGITVLNQLRQDNWGKNAKVIILTNLSGDKKLREQLNVIGNDFLIKSDWKIEDVVRKIQDKLKE